MFLTLYLKTNNLYNFAKHLSKNFSLNRLLFFIEEENSIEPSTSENLFSLNLDNLH